MSEPSTSSVPEVDPDFSLGGFALWAHGRQFPTSLEFWDWNWLIVSARARASGALVEVKGPILHLTEFEAFASALEKLNRAASGTTRLDCMEPNLGLTVSCNATGHVDLVVSITPNHLDQMHRIRYSLDQTFLGPAVAACKRLMDRFPVLGAPNERRSVEHTQRPLRSLAQ
jgi:hypothetical protein